MTRREVNKKLADSIECERIAHGFSQEQMAKKLDMSLSAYKRVITYSVDKIDFYTVYKLYQMTGKLAYEYLGLSDYYLDIERKVSRLSSRQLAYINSIIEFEVDFAENNSDYENYISVYVPTGNMEDGMIYDSSNVEKINVSKYKIKYGDRISCGIKITSNHLHPVYNKDDILLIEKRAVRDGDTGIFINKRNGCAYVRKFHQTNPCRLDPINDYGTVFYVDSSNKEDMDQWIKFGIVLAKIR